MSTDLDKEAIAREVGYAGNLLDLYQGFTPTTFISSGDHNQDMAHIQNGVQAEAGEIAGAYQKFYRGDYDEEELHKRLEGEVGGLFYYLSQLANMEGIRLSTVLLKNRDALIDRQNRGVLQGDGDNR